MKKLLLSVLVIGLAAALMGGGVFAVFTDSETSADNVFTGGTLDLQIDANPDGATTNWVDDPDVPSLNSITELDALLNSLAPGGDPINLWIAIRNNGNVDGIADLHFNVTADRENGFAEPEVEEYNGEGELDDNIVVSVYYPGDNLPGDVPNPANLYYSNTLANLNGSNLNLGTLAGGSESSIRIIMSIPSSVGNEIMTDQCDVDIEFTLHQPS